MTKAWTTMTKASQCRKYYNWYARRNYMRASWSLMSAEGLSSYNPVLNRKAQTCADLMTVSVKFDSLLKVDEKSSNTKTTYKINTYDMVLSHYYIITVQFWFNSHRFINIPLWRSSFQNNKFGIYHSMNNNGSIKQAQPTIKSI